MIRKRACLEETIEGTTYNQKERLTGAASN